jgi:hypothetical protein
MPRSEIVVLKGRLQRAWHLQVDLGSRGLVLGFTMYLPLRLVVGCCWVQRNHANASQTEAHTQENRHICMRSHHMDVPIEKVSYMGD